MYELGDMSRAPALIERVRELIEHLGARAWKPTVEWHLAMLHETEGQHRQAIDEMKRGIEIAREVSLGFQAPQMLGFFTAITDDPVARKAALIEAEGMLQKESLGHGFLTIYRYAMDACLRSGDWNEVERYANALEEYTRPEPLPSSNFFIARGRALAAFGRGQRDATTTDALQRLRDEAAGVGLVTALPALEEALVAI